MSTGYFNNSVATVQQQLKDCYEANITTNNWGAVIVNYGNIPAVNEALRGKQFIYYSLTINHNQGTSTPIVEVYDNTIAHNRIYVGVSVVNDNTITIYTQTPIDAHILVMGGFKNVP